MLTDILPNLENVLNLFSFPLFNPNILVSNLQNFLSAKFTNFSNSDLRYPTLSFYSKSTSLTIKKSQSLNISLSIPLLFHIHFFIALFSYSFASASNCTRLASISSLFTPAKASANCA